METGHEIGIWVDSAKSVVWFALGILAWKLAEIPSAESLRANSRPNFPSSAPLNRSESRSTAWPRLPPRLARVPAQTPPPPCCPTAVFPHPRQRVAPPSPARCPGPAGRWPLRSPEGRRPLRSPTALARRWLSSMLRPAALAGRSLSSMLRPRARRQVALPASLHQAPTHARRQMGAALQPAHVPAGGPPSSSNQCARRQVLVLDAPAFIPSSTKYQIPYYVHPNRI